MLMELSLTDCPADQYALPCRICSQVGLNSVTQSQPTTDSPTPIDLAWCPACSLVQWIGEPATRAAHGSSSGVAVGAQALVDRLRKTRRLGPDSLVVGMAGSGDLLKSYRDAGIPVLAIEPVTEAADIRTICSTFGQDLALDLFRANQRADVIHANDTLLHAADLNSVASGFATLLKPDGIVVAEVPYLKDLAECVGFNTLDRSELCLFSLTALTQLFGQHGMEIIDVECMKAHGGVLRTIATRSGTTSVSPAVYELLDGEASWVRDPAFYLSFGETLAPSARDRWAA